MYEYKVEDLENYPYKRSLIVEAPNSTQAKRQACKVWGLKTSDKYHGATSLTATKVNSVSLVGRSISLYFIKANCFKERSGQCSLEAPDDFLKQFKDDPNKEKANSYYCKNLSILVKDKAPHLFPVFLYKAKCGHYENGSGQHRVCIAGHLKISVPINIGEIKHKLCGHCSNPEYGYILKSF